MKKKHRKRRRYYTPTQTKDGRWKLQWPIPGKTKSGRQKVKTEFFATKQDADARAAEINERFRNEGFKHADRPEKNRQVETTCLPGEIITVAEAGKLYIDAYYRALTAAEALLKSGKSKRRANEVLATKGEHTDTYVSLNTLETKYAPAIKKLCDEKQLGKVLVKNVKASDLRLHLECLDLAVSTYNDRIGIIDRFFKWCMEPCRNFVQASPASGLKRLDHEWGEPEILSVDEVYRLFRAAEKIDPGVIPVLTLRAHAGLRTCETMRMNEGDVNWEFKTINIRKEVAKPSSPDIPLPRKLEMSQGMPATVWSWLESVGGESMKLDRVNLYKRMKAVFAEAQTEYRHNCLRHSFCSYAYSLLGDDAKVRKWSGHRQEKTFHDFYVNVSQTSRAEAEKYFSLKPLGNHAGRLKLRHCRHQPRIKWPSDKTFKLLVLKMSNVRLAEILGCTEAAVRKERKKRGI